MPDRLVILYRGNRPPATALIERLTDTVYATEDELPDPLPRQGFPPHLGAPAAP
jgi:hypothetical protein